MKKFIVMVAVAATCIMCKKGEAVSSASSSYAGASADSLYSATSENMNEVQEKADAALDSAGVRIRDFEKTTEDVKDRIENTSKIVDSLSDKISNVSLQSNPVRKDSAGKKEKIVVHVPAPKVIRETRIIYKNRPEKKNANVSVPQNNPVKTGVLDVWVDDAEAAKETVKEEVAKYDGIVSRENISLTSDEKQRVYLQVKVPVRKFGYLIDELSNIPGRIENKSIEHSGQQPAEHMMCDIEVTLYGKNGIASAEDRPETFGEKSFAAVSSGWNVITSVFLFLLPLWPVFLIAGAGYYFYKKKKATKH